MKKYLISILVASLVVMRLISPIHAQMVTMDDALTLASNWIDVIIQNAGDWGGAAAAEVASIQEFKRGDRALGYFCLVRPRGYIIVSLRKELVPVKAYSAVSDLDPELDEGMADLIKDGIEQVLNHIQQRLGPLEKVPSEELITIINKDYRPLWAALEQGDPKINYQSGNELLSSSWHQYPPYNDQCPNIGCTWPPCYSNTNGPVGCVATAGAQIMRYWNWPPYGEGSPYNDTYDWPNMPDRFNGCTWVAAEINAVAELSREVGQAVGMSYGCSGSSANTYDMEGVYQDHYRYSNDCNKKDRNDYSDDNWFAWIKYHLNQNQPIHYRVTGHSIVSDGWREIGSPVLRQYHMNYGWDNGYNTWYSLDSLHLGGIDEEYMLVDIYPEQAVRNNVSGTYLRESFPYRYFDQDATGESATFESGQRLQFLPNIRVQCTSATGGSIRIYGSSSYHTKLFTRGDESVGALISNGAIKLSRYGGIKFY